MTFMKRMHLFVSCLLLIITPPTYSESTINCRAKHSLYHDNTKIVAFYHFIINKNDGILSINGKINSNGMETVISRNIYFSYDLMSQSNYIGKSSKIAKIPADNTPDNIMEKHYPLFFTKEGKILPLNITQGPSGSYLISFIRTPLFYCMSL